MNTKKIFKKLAKVVKDYLWEEEEVELNDFDKFKIDKLMKKTRDYYFTLATTTPELLADMLARQTLSEDIKNPDKVNELYETAFGKLNMNELRLM